MAIDSLTIHQFRNIYKAKLSLSSRCNLFIGPNGSGKTALLESIYMLSLTRSFRTRTTRRVIQHEKDTFAVSAHIPSFGQIGIEKTIKGERRIRVNGENEELSSVLADLLPVQLINPDSYRLIESGPQERRQFLDWGVFHVEHAFIKAWRQYQQCLKQRNIALKQTGYNGDAAQVRLWDPVLIQYAEQLHLMRQTYFDKFIKVFLPIFTGLLDSNLAVTYKPGWDTELGLAEKLNQSISRDLQVGYTNYGAHRTDLSFTVDKIPVLDLLSRGQQKLLVCAMRLAQGKILNELTKKSCVYLIDDLPAELDDINFEKIGRLLSEIDSQIFVTGVDKEMLLRFIDFEGDDKDVSVFHVEHGIISSSSAQ